MPSILSIHYTLPCECVIVCFVIASNRYNPTSAFDCFSFSSAFLASWHHPNESIPRFDGSLKNMAYGGAFETDPLPDHHHQQQQQQTVKHNHTDRKCFFLMFRFLFHVNRNYILTIYLKGFAAAGLPKKSGQRRILLVSSLDASIVPCQKKVRL